MMVNVSDVRTPGPTGTRLCSAGGLVFQRVRCVRLGTQALDPDETGDSPTQPLVDAQLDRLVLGDHSHGACPLVRNQPQLAPAASNATSARPNGQRSSERRRPSRGATRLRWRQPGSTAGAYRFGGCRPSCLDREDARPDCGDDSRPRANSQHCLSQPDNPQYRPRLPRHLP